MPSRFSFILRGLGKRRDLLLGIPALALLLAGLTGYVFYPAWKGWRHWQQAEQALVERDYTQAATQLRKYLALNPSHRQGRFLFARTLRRAGRFDEARAELAHAVRLDWVPEQIELEETLMRVQQRGAQGRDLQSLSAFLHARHPDERIILEALAQGDRDNVQLDQAMRWLDLWVERFPDDWLARLRRGELLQAFMRLDAAQADYQKLLELRPDYHEAHLRLGLLALGNRSQTAEAENHLRRYLEMRPDHAEALVGLARCRREQGDLDAAAAAVTRALDREPGDAEALLLAGSIEVDRGHFEAALPLLRRAEQSGADPQTTHFQLVQALQRLGKSDEAKVHQRRFEELEKAKPALDSALLAVLKEPGNPERQFELGRLHAAAGQGAKAERDFLAALRLDPAHRPSHDALAEYYGRSNRPGAASLAEMHRRLAKQ